MLNVGRWTFSPSPPSFPRSPDALEHEIRQHPLERLVEIREMIVHAELPAPVLKRSEVVAQRLAIRLAHHRRIGDQIRAAFEIDETHGPREIEVVFLAIEQVKDGHVVFEKMQMFEAVEQWRDLGEKIADDDHERALA